MASAPDQVMQQKDDNNHPMRSEEMCLQEPYLSVPTSQTHMSGCHYSLYPPSNFQAPEVTSSTYMGDPFSPPASIPFQHMQPSLYGAHLPPQPNMLDAFPPSQFTAYQNPQQSNMATYLPFSMLPQMVQSQQGYFHSPSDIRSIPVPDMASQRAQCPSMTCYQTPPNTALPFNQPQQGTQFFSSSSHTAADSGQHLYRAEQYPVPNPFGFQTHSLMQNPTANTKPLFGIHPCLSGQCSYPASYIPPVPMDHSGSGPTASIIQQPNVREQFPLPSSMTAASSRPFLESTHPNPQPCLAARFNQPPYLPAYSNPPPYQSHLQPYSAALHSNPPQCLTERSNPRQFPAAHPYQPPFLGDHSYPIAQAPTHGQQNVNQSPSVSSVPQAARHQIIQSTTSPPTSTSSNFHQNAQLSLGAFSRLAQADILAQADLALGQSQRPIITSNQSRMFQDHQQPSIVSSGMQINNLPQSNMAPAFDLRDAVPGPPRINVQPPQPSLRTLSNDEPRVAASLLSPPDSPPVESNRLAYITFLQERPRRVSEYDGPPPRRLRLDSPNLLMRSYRYDEYNMMYSDYDDDPYDESNTDSDDDDGPFWMGSSHLRRRRRQLLQGRDDPNRGMDDDQALAAAIAASLTPDATPRNPAAARRAMETHLSACLRPYAHSIKVDRDDVWGCSLVFFKDVKITDKGKQLMVLFRDSEGNREEAVDDGGPKREYLQLLLEAIVSDSRLLHGDKEHGLLIRPNISQHFAGNFRLLGIMLATIIAQRGRPPAVFAPPVVDAILGVDSVTSLKYVPSSEIRESLQKIREAKDASELEEVLEGCQWRYDLDGIPARVTMETREEFNKLCVHYYVILNSRAMLDQIIDGLNHCGILTLLRKHKIRHLLEYDPEATLTAEKVMNLLSPRNEFRHLEEKEQTIVTNVREFLTATENGSLCDDLLRYYCPNEAQTSFINTLTPGKVLTFVTGCSREPAGGFYPRPSIVFQYSATWRLPHVSTCSNELHITVHEEAMTSSSLAMALLTSLMNSEKFTKT